jgi:hypothetical protein
LHCDPSKAYDLRIKPERFVDGAERFDVACSLDGTQVLGRAEAVTPLTPSTIVSGLDLYGAADVADRFTGPELDMLLEPDNPGAHRPGLVGPLHMVVRFPLNKIGRHEPLLTTGRTGAGDLLYVIYEDDHHVRIAFDHWGGSGATSEPIAVDYGLPHELWVRTGALYPAEGVDSLWAGLAPEAQKILKSQVQVVLDGENVLSAGITAHPSLMDDVTVAQNRIGGSTADAVFSGSIDFEERLSPADPLPKGLSGDALGNQAP